jgi:hypothetical protein
LRQIRWQKLQRYKSTKFGVLGLVDHTHSTRAELLDNAVMRNDLPDHGKQNLKLEGTGKSMKGKELTPKRMDGYGPHPPGRWRLAISGSAGIESNERVLCISL